ncbi:MAG TPA: hypothetical protein VLA23_14250 [Candidatus Limnocylindrales bacterium]|nr:hypothetical protein [Candidatus Limnocylindrales bacterium]
MRRALAATALVALLVAGCGLGSVTDTAPSPPPAAQASLSPTLQAARAEVISVLGAAAIIVDDAAVDYRPGESALVASAPRHVLQAVLPEAPSGGFVVVYEFVDATAAATAGREWADYIASGIGRVQFPTGSVFTIRQDGAALVFHAWSPDGAPDPEGEAAIATALGSIGVDWPVSG